MGSVKHQYGTVLYIICLSVVYYYIHVNEFFSGYCSAVWPDATATAANVILLYALWCCPMHHTTEFPLIEFVNKMNKNANFKYFLFHFLIYHTFSEFITKKSH